MRPKSKGTTPGIPTDMTPSQSYEKRDVISVCEPRSTYLPPVEALVKTTFPSSVTAK